LQGPDKLLGVLGLLQFFIVGGTLGAEICRQIVIRVTETIRAFNPNFLAPQAFSKCLQDTDFVVDAVDALGSVGRCLQKNILELGPDDTVDRDLVTGDKLLSTVAVGFEPG
jgi:hypothetical protein